MVTENQCEVVLSDGSGILMGVVSSRMILSYP